LSSETGFLAIVILLHSSLFLTEYLIFFSSTQSDTILMCFAAHLEEMFRKLTFHVESLIKRVLMILSIEFYFVMQDAIENFYNFDHQ
jgi:hypothetical protein